MVDVDYPVAEQPVTEDGLIDELFEIDGPAMVSQEQ